MLLLKGEHFFGDFEGSIVDFVGEGVEVMFAEEESPGFYFLLVFGFGVDLHDFALVFVDAPVFESVLVGTVGDVFAVST